ncbi:RDD family protein [Micromonospora sp. CPCC 206061]|uniref:RDD family protein n=1 Tax=Micromonospora sp. CPCC 206061 TaxID=3122410 RepID=UPI002FF3C9F7
MSVAPGWYKDPAEPSTQRYWDGEGWVGTPLPADATPPPGPPPEPAPPPVAPPPLASRPVALPGPISPPPPINGRPAPPPGPPPPIAAPPQFGYRPPAPPPRPHGMRLASVGARFVARLIDFLLVLLLNAAVNGWFIYRYAQEIAPLYRAMNERMLEGRNWFEDLPQASPQAGRLQIVILLIATALWFAYEVPATANTGQTIGKRIMGIKVVRTESTERLGFGRSFRRWNTLGLPTLLWLCCVGFILQLVDCLYLLFDRPLYQALHDKSARTVVVELPRPGTAQPAPPAQPGGTT